MISAPISQQEGPSWGPVFPQTKDMQIRSINVYKLSIRLNVRVNGWLSHVSLPGDHPMLTESGSSPTSMTLNRSSNIDDE